MRYKISDYIFKLIFTILGTGYCIYNIIRNRFILRRLDNLDKKNININATSHLNS